MAVLKRNGLEYVSEHTTVWPAEKGGGTKQTGRYERRLM